MGRSRRWVGPIFALLVLLVVAFVAAVYLLPEGIGLPSTFEVSPSEITLYPGQGWQFRAVYGGRSVHGVDWRASGGTIGPEGFYTAPGVPGDYEVSAQHPATGYRTGATVHIAEGPAGTSTTATISAQRPVTPTDTSSPPASTPTPFPPTQTVPPLSSTPTAMSPPTLAPTPTQTATPVPTPSPVPPFISDASDDLVSYDTLIPVAGSLPGCDIQQACFDEGMRLVQILPGELAAEVTDWDAQENLVLWMRLHEPVPGTSASVHYWLFALDIDGNTGTGQPLGGRLINPDLGVEITVGVQSNLGLGVDFLPYMFVWNAGIGDAERRTANLEARLSETRDTVFIRVPKVVVGDIVRTLSQTEPDWDGVTGRAAAMVMSDAGLLVDFSPNLP